MYILIIYYNEFWEIINLCVCGGGGYAIGQIRLSP